MQLQRPLFCLRQIFHVPVLRQYGLQSVLQTEFIQNGKSWHVNGNLRSILVICNSRFVGKPLVPGDGSARFQVLQVRNLVEKIAHFVDAGFGDRVFDSVADPQQ